jgi:hypothetical protein
MLPSGGWFDGPSSGYDVGAAFETIENRPDSSRRLAGKEYKVTRQRSTISLVLWFALTGCTAASAAAGDWPQWRFDAGHTAASPDGLPDQLHLQWIRQYSPRVPVWDDALNRDMMPYDRIFEPVVAEGRLFLSFNDADKVAAFDVRDGSQLWAFYADGPVRFPPVVHGDSVLVHQRRRLSVLRRRRGRATAVAVPRRADRAEGDRKPARDFVLAGARRPRGGRRHGLFRGQHLAVHGDVHLRLGCAHRAGPVAERGDGRSVPEATAQRSVVRRRGAARPVDRVRRLGPGARRPVASGRLRSRDGRVAFLQFRRQGPRRLVRRR